MMTLTKNMGIIRHICRSIFYSIRNALFYRSEWMPANRNPNSYARKHINDAISSNSKEQIFLFATNYMLMGIGLIVTEKPGNHLAWIYLTKRQKEVMNKVRSVGGYNIDLL